MPRPPLKLDDFLPYRLSLASNAVSQVIARAYEGAHDLKPPEWRVMAVLAERGGELTQQDVVGLTQMDKVTVSRAARGLEQKRLVRRREDRDDARSLRLSLTREGRALHARVAPAALAFERAVLEGLSPAEVAALKDLLRRLEAQATRALTRR